MNFEEGEILLFDKPYGWTSFDMVNKVKFMIKKKTGLKKIKVGHAGTLDPLASGLLIICTGKKTKQITAIQDRPKEYIANIELGRTTPSFDQETETDGVFPFNHISDKLLNEKLAGMVGETDQVPPVFSAKYINGKRAYEYAREGKEVEMKANRVRIDYSELVENAMPHITVKIGCSKGTYIRSFARDLGIALESGGCLTGLRRTAIGEFSIEKALTIADFKNILDDCNINISIS
ncbi:MAG TPA: tRNA pseudouridine(55) synthase TruB [Bacteroidales bacterium]|jgi:tRNA pseudouridine55 synthase|nr:tRNA pseudouridine(55) synthase TruB [Bacteroidales bacterium]